MTPEKKQASCVVCKAYLFEEDDVVHCPVCGAPHHRDCYNKLGHCALEEFHGTPDEYNPEKQEENQNGEKNTAWEPINDSHTIFCKMCGAEYDSSLQKCPECSAPNFEKMGGSFVQFDFLGGVPKDYVIEDGVTAEEARKFVLSNTHRYIPKFATLSKKKRTSWNWLAFLFPGQWMFSRKMIGGGFITCFLSLLSTLLLFPMMIHLQGSGMPSEGSYSEIFSWMMDQWASIPIEIRLVALLGSVLGIALSIVVGIFGDYFYKKHAIAKIKDIKANSQEVEEDFRKKGGVNFFLFLISYLALEYLPQIIAIFI